MNDASTRSTVVAVLNRLLEAELAGVVRYTHYSFLVFGFGRIPIVSWLRDAGRRIAAARAAGRRVDHHARRLSVAGDRAAARLAQARHRRDAARVARRPKARALALYRELLRLVEGRSVALEEFARQMIHAEELHAAEVDKMLRKPGELAAVRAADRVRGRAVDVGVRHAA